VELNIALVAYHYVPSPGGICVFQVSCLPPYHRPRNNSIISTALTTLGETTEFLLAYTSLDPVVPSSHPTHSTHSARGPLLGGLEGRKRLDVLLVVGHLTGVYETTALAPSCIPFHSNMGCGTWGAWDGAESQGPCR
jgi:hypothetical protein